MRLLSRFIQSHLMESSGQDMSQPSGVSLIMALTERQETYSLHYPLYPLRRAQMKKSGQNGHILRREDG